MKKLELKGQVFGRLTVIREDSERPNSRGVRWVCSCTCGNTLSVISNNLRGGNTKSCGCLRKEITTLLKTTHGLRNHPLYKVYHNMKERCNNPENTNYKNYGDRGITVSDIWLGSFMNFYNDVKIGYKEGLQLDRKDNDKGYSKENCRWVTRQQNQWNTRPVRESSSEYKGVSWYKPSKKWTAKIAKDGKLRHLGYFVNEKEAALAYNVAAKELFGKYASYNVISYNLPERRALNKRTRKSFIKEDMEEYNNQVLDEITELSQELGLP